MQDDTPDTDNVAPATIAPNAPQVVASSPQQVVQQAPQDSLRHNSNVLGRRVWAYLIDLVPWVVAFVIAAQHFGQVNTANSNYNANLAGVPSLIFALIWLSYYIVLEWLAGGSLGKLIVGIRVRNEQGEKLPFVKSLIRNLLRLVDGFPYIIPNLVGFIIASTNDKKQRLGDKAAHTVVIKSDKTQPASMVALLTLLILTVVGIVVIVTVPSSKANTTQTATANSTISAANSNQSGQNGTAEDVSNQFINDLAANNPIAAYQLTTPAYQAKTNLAQNASTFLTVSKLMTEKPVELSGQSSNQGSYVYNVQTSQGQKSIIVSLQYASGNWLINGWQMINS